MAAFSEDKQGYERLRILLRCAAIVLGIAETWATRHTMGADGVAYLDMGDAYWRGDWHMAINANISPLYSWLLGLGLKVLKPSSYWEFPVVHLINFMIYLGALAAFDFLLSALIDFLRKTKSHGASGLVTLPDWAWYGIGYTLFLWVTFDLIRLETVTPDLCVAAFVYLSSGLVARIRGGGVTWLTFLFLGLALGFGYLAKTIMLPLSLIFLGIALFSAGQTRKSLPRVLLAAAVFLAIGTPYIVALSGAAGQLTFGEAGKYNYMQWVRRPDYVQIPASTFMHPINVIYQSPRAIEFSRPDKSTFPLWYEPSYWWKGYRVQFHLRDQLRALKAGAIACYGFLFLKEAGLVASILVLFCATPGVWLSLKALFKSWYLLIPGGAGLGAFSLILVEGRYIAPFVLLLWLGILSSVRLQLTEVSKKMIMGVVLAIVFTMGAPIVFSTFFDVAAARRKAPVDWEVAQALNQIDVRAGDKVGLIRHETPSSPWIDFYWARLARIRIIAEVPPEEVDKYWASSPATQAGVVSAFERVGAKAVIANDPPPCASTETWRRLGNTNFYAFMPR